MKIRKTVSLMLLAALLLGLLSAFAVTSAGDELPFTDVKKGKWYYKSVQYVYENDLMNGDSKTTFSPKGSLTRAMFITIIGRLAGVEGGGKSPFTDTKDGKWYSPYVAWAAEMGIVNGFPDGTFRPNDPITREQMATSVARFIDAAGLRTVNSGGIFRFNDAGKIAKYAKAPVESLKKIGVFAGDTNMNFNPKSNTTRAEAATVVMRLREAIVGAWQGYLPEAGGDKPLIYGASYLYENGSIFAGGMEKDLDLSGEYPVIKAYMDGGAAYRTYLEPNTAGISINYGEIDVSATPFVKICYSVERMEDAAPTVRYNVNKTKKETAGFTQDLTLTPGEDEDGMKTAYIDLNEVNTAHPDINYSSQLANLLFVPCPEDQSPEGKFVIRYIGFFATEDEARAFTAGSDEEISDYLKNYELKMDLDWREYTDEDRAYYENLLSTRITEIKNTKSELTPEMIKARGGTCYYVSSIHGDDKNDGLTPQTAWKTPDALWNYKPGPNLYLRKLKAGDGVFFERGSVFYPKRYHNNTVSTLNCNEGIDYGAYGTGPKPLFTCALDFTESNNVGDWQATEYPNIWKIDNVDPKPGYEEDGTYNENYWCGERSEIGRMYFNGGEYEGLRIMASSGKQTFGEKKKTNYKGLFYNGFEWYEAVSRPMTDPSTTLLHNLEFFHDYETGALYLYFDRGNPADYFDDIKACRNGTAAWTASNSTIDNLAFLYSTNYAVRAGEKNVTFTNCEIGCVGGSLSSVESGIEIFGNSDNVLITNCYVHDVGDGALTSQCSAANPDDPTQINNVNYIGNVMACCGVNAEIWNHLTNVDENGYSASRITNCTLKDNIIAYAGYGLTEKQANGSYSYGSGVNSSMYGEFDKCRVENNIFLYGTGMVYYAYMATYRQPRGWEIFGNTYVSDVKNYNMGFTYETLNHLDHSMWKRARVTFPYTEVGLKWITSLGVDPKGVFFHYTDDDSHHVPDAGYFFMSGWQLEHGE